MTPVKEERTLTAFELFGLITVSICINLFFSPAGSVFSAGGAADWLSGLIALAAALALFLGYVRIARRYPGKSLYQLCELCAGKAAAKIIMAAVLLLVLLSMADKLFLALEMLGSFSYPSTSKALMAAVVMAMAFYGAHKGIFSLGKAAKYTAFLILAITLIVLLAGMKIYQINYLFPLFGSGGADFSLHTLYVSSGLDNFVVVLLFLDRIKSTDMLKKSGSWAVSVSGAALILAMSCYGMAIAYKTGGNGSFGILDIAKDTQISTFFQRFEPIVVLFAAGSILIWLALYLTAGTRALQELLGTRGSYRTALMVPVAAAALLAGLLYESNAQSRSDWLAFSDQYSIFFILGILLILWLAPLFKKWGAKRASALLMVLVLLPSSLCGCGDYKEIEQEAYAIMIGYDVAENDQISITVRFMNPDGGEEGGSMNTASGEDSGSLPSYVYQVTADSLTDGMNLLGSVLTKSVSLVHARMVVFSEELAQRGLSEYIEPLIRSYEVQNSLMLVVCGGRAGDYVSCETAEVSGDVTAGIEMIVNDVSDSDSYVVTSLNEFWNAVCSGQSDPAVAYGGVSGGESGDSLLAGELPVTGEGEAQLAGTALFDEDRLTAIADGDETAQLRMLQGELQKLRITLEDGIVAQVKSLKNSSISVDTASDPAHIQVEVFVRASLVNYSVSDVGSEELSRVNAEIADYLHGQAEAFLEKTQLTASDVCGFGGYAARNFATEQSFSAYDWDAAYPNAEISLTVHVTL